MTDQDEPAMPAASSGEPETPEIFLKTLAATLKNIEGIDKDLVEILATDILVGTPAKDASARAQAAIAKLARTRAMPAKGEQADADG
ncbi:MAG: hypothetical protein Q8M18_05790 [Bradyrhizobium sp.]|nr:hypothetical protein [Bradyrhizobium sp.]